MSYLTRPVAYLEDTDFDKHGNLTNPNIPKNKPVVIFAHASWCPHCVTAKPAFQEFANKMKGKVFTAAIQADGERKSEQALGNRIDTLKPGFIGFPDYLLYVNGQRVDSEPQGRDVAALVEFSSQM